MAKTSPTFELENALAQKFGGQVCGVDEAGRGAWAGPVAAAAVILDPATTPEGLNDSKVVAEKRREKLADMLMDVAQVGVGQASVEEIDEIGVGKATYLAMQRAVAALPSPPVCALIDGHIAPALPCPTETVIKGDGKCQAIAAASIVAKVTRDRQLRLLAEEFPHYGWLTNKGYGAKAHQVGLAELGVTSHHRRSFAPIRALLNA